MLRIKLRRSVWISVLALACEGQVVSAEVIQFETRARANLEYQLDCLSRYVRCTRASMSLDVSQEELPLLEAWRARRKAEQQAVGPMSTGSRGKLPTIANSSDVPSRLMPGVGVTTETIGEIKAAEILAHFEPRYQKRWISHDATHLARMKSGLNSLLRNTEIRDAIRRSQQFHGVRETNSTDVQLIATSGTTHGSLTTIGADQIYAESPLNESAENRLPVIVHELTHRWQQAMPEAMANDIINAFLNSESDCALSGFHWFEEVIASAIGNGVIESILLEQQAFDTYAALPMSFYADADIDRLAKAMMPLIEEYLDQRQVMDVAFVAQYLQTVASTLPDRCRRVASEMRGMTLLTSSAYATQFASRLHREWQPNTLVTIMSESVNGFAQRPYSQLPTLVLTTKTQLKTLAPAVRRRTVERLSKDTSLLIFADRSHRPTIYYVIGDRWQDVETGLERLVSQSPASFNGEWYRSRTPGLVPN